MMIQRYLMLMQKQKISWKNLFPANYLKTLHLIA